MSELNVTAHIYAPFHMAAKKSSHDVIFGRDRLQELGIQLDFQNNLIVWPGINLSLKPIDCKMRTHFTSRKSRT